MNGEPKILLCSLWQRTSERGNEYLTGFLGKARIIGFRGEPVADDTLTWNIYLQEWPASDDRPFFDDLIDDIEQDSRTAPVATSSPARRPEMSCR